MGNSFNLHPIERPVEVKEDIIEQVRRDLENLNFQEFPAEEAIPQICQAVIRSGARRGRICGRRLPCRYHPIIQQPPLIPIQPSSPIVDNMSDKEPFESDECVICLKKLKKRNISIMICGHSIHTSCFSLMKENSLNLRIRCPLCRRIVG